MMTTTGAKRPDIQALRAVAVCLVVAFHLRPTLVPGGYVGVDVFFVISGFLIIGQLVRQATSTGRLALGRFWGRRARRLLPAASLVLLASTVLTLTVIPDLLRRQFLTEIIASSLYVQNWVLAGDSVNYLAEQNQPSIVQHYWSLSVEEQFYIVIPLLVVAALWIFRRKPPAKVIFVLLTTVTVLSFAYSVWLTPVAPSAYFVSTTRVWEFAIGGLLSFVTMKFRGVIAVSMTIAALLLLGGSAILFSGSTSFPGFIALVPVAGTVLLIASGARGVMAVGAWRPVQYLGEISYSVYLWHWPLIVVWPFLFGVSVGLRAAAVIAIATVVLAGLTSRFLENPIRNPRHDSRWRTIAVAAIAMGSVLSLAGSSDYVENANSYQTLAAAVHRSEKIHTRCWGAAAITNHCGPQVLSTSPNFARQDLNPIDLDDRCRGGRIVRLFAGSAECSYGSGSTIVVLVGDSHARHWIAPLQVVARERGWKIITFARNSCPFGNVPSTDAGVKDISCTTWRASAIKRIIQLHPTDVFVSSLTAYGYHVANFGMGTAAQQLAGYRDYLTRMTNAGLTVYTFRDVPYFPTDVPTCVASGVTCNYPRSQVLDNHPDALSEAARLTPGVTQIDMTPYLCPTTCRAVIGGVIVYRDRHHLTATFARSLAPYLAEALS